MILWGHPIESPLRLTPELIKSLMPEFRHATARLEGSGLHVDHYRVTLDMLGRYVVEAMPSPRPGDG